MQHATIDPNFSQKLPHSVPRVEHASLDGPDRHRDDEAWYVLEGTLYVQMGDREVEVRAGSGALVPRGTPHTYWNPGPGPTRYLLIMTSNIYELIQEIHAMKERTPAALETVFRKHDSQLLNA